MPAKFPRESEMGPVESVHEVPVYASAGRLVPGVFGLLALGAGIVSLTMPKRGTLGSLVMVAVGVALIAITVWLVRRLRAAGPACAVYRDGIAVRRGEQIDFARWGAINVLRQMVRGYGTSLYALTINAPEFEVVLQADFIVGAKKLARALEARVQ
jgi:hypothetical protein